MKKILITLFCITFLLSGCNKPSSESNNTESISSASATESDKKTSEEPEVKSMNVTSSSIDDDGMLALRCAKKGENDEARNLSPQLSWDAVDGAACYAVYMFDESANSWIHWKVTDLSKTSLDEGEITRGYKGPYPPAGEYHTYSIFVYALRNTPDEYDKSFDVGGKRTDVEEKLDTYEDKFGNVITSGYISGKYKN